MNPILNMFSLTECNNILKKKLNSENIVVDSYKFSQLSEKVGFLAEHYYLEVIYYINQKRKIIKFFVKCMISSESERKFILETGAFYKECRMFQELVPEFTENNINIIKDCIPICYLVQDMNFLIFEDLESKGFKIMDHRKSLNLKHVKEALKTIAKFHCSTLILEKKIEHKEGDSNLMMEKCPAIFQETFYTSSLKSTLEAIKKGATTLIELFSSESEINLLTFKRLTCDLFDQFPEIVKPSTSYKNTICVSDLWSSNIMFKVENEKLLQCRLVDFQSYRYAPPGQDLLAFLYLSTDKIFRKEHMEDMMTFYYREMSKILMEHNIFIDDVLPVHDFKSSCDYYKTFAIAQTMNHYPMIMIPKEEIDTIFTNPERVRKFLFEDRSEVILEMCNKYSKYANRLQETVEDLRDIFVDKGLL